MTLSEGRLILRERRPEEVANHAIDIFFLSLALDATENAIGILLSGCGDDGVRGAKQVDRNGGTVIAQNPTTAEFPYLPKALISSDHPDFILTPQGIADKIKETIL
jgi:chemotaxis response regulator CheB